MKNIRDNFNLKGILLAMTVLLIVSCERDLSDDAVLAGNSTEGDVFIDTPVAMGPFFYFPFADSKLTAGSFDGEGYQSQASIRIDVPNADDPEGNYAGAILRVDGPGRDLSGFDALTFYAKASQGVNVADIGFGLDFLADKYQVTASNLSFGTGWTKYIIPIPDASKLINERGLFWYATGTQNTGGLGYAIWFDDIKFEKLGNIAQPRPAILNGEDIVQETFIGANGAIFTMSQTVNLGSGQDITVSPAPSYFDWVSSNPNVATVDDVGFVSVVGSGTAVITASLNGIDAEGSLTIISLGDFVGAPVPDVDPANVISVFSDAYTNVPVDYYNGFFNGDGQTTQGGAPPIAIDGGEVINYTDLNFVGIGTFLEVAPVNASAMTHIHVDINVNEVLDPGDRLTLQLINGVQTANEISGSVVINESQLLSNDWVSLDIPLSSFAGLSAKDALGLIFFISTNNANVPTISNIFVDNIYYYTVPTSPTDAPEAPTEDEAGNNVICVYSDAYTDVGNDGLNNFNSGSILSVETIAANDVLKYTNLNFTGLEFLGPNIIDASASTTLHLDIWSPDANDFKIKLVDFGADGEFGGGDDSEHEINLGPTPTGEWVAYDIPLSDFIGLTSTEHLAQIIFVNAPIGTLFVDNLYFYN